MQDLRNRRSSKAGASRTVTQTTALPAEAAASHRPRSGYPIRWIEDDGLRWPRRDGLKWPRFASVVVLVDLASIWLWWCHVPVVAEASPEGEVERRWARGARLHAVGARRG